MLSRPLSDISSIALSVLLLVPLALIASAIVIAISRRRSTDRSTLIDRLALVWLLASLAAVAILTLQPLGGGFSAPHPMELNPIAPVSVPDAIDNVLLYLPVGFFACVYWRTKRCAIAWAGLVALVVSVAIELAQGLFPINRAASSHDVLFNSLGGMVGAACAIALSRRRDPMGAVLDK